MGEADRSLLDNLESTVKKHSDIVGMASGYPQNGIWIPSIWHQNPESRGNEEGQSDEGTGGCLLPLILSCQAEPDEGGDQKPEEKAAGICIDIHCFKNEARFQSGRWPG